MNRLRSGDLLGRSGRASVPDESTVLRRLRGRRLNAAVTPDIIVLLGDEVLICEDPRLPSQWIRKQRVVEYRTSKPRSNLCPKRTSDFSHSTRHPKRLPEHFGI